MEVDIVMDANTPLYKAHDVSQRLQDKLEVLPNVERAFVHVDHEWTHTPVYHFVLPVILVAYNNRRNIGNRKLQPINDLHDCDALES